MINNSLIGPNSSIIVVIIAGVFGIITTVLGAFITRKVNKNSKTLNAVRNQVENGHHSNLRDESDSRHADNSDKLDFIIKNQKIMRASITTNNRNIKATNSLVNILATRVTSLTETTLRHDNQISDIEHTIPTTRKRNIK